MKLKPLTPPPGWVITRSIVKYPRRRRIPLATTQEIDKVIIVGNGVRDAVVCMILAHKLNGEEPVGITKPREERGIVALRIIPTLLSALRLNKILFIVDQEESKLENIWNKANETFRTHGMECEKWENHERVSIFNCTYSGRKVKVIIVVNGLNILSITKHAIEDHLLYIMAISEEKRRHS